jgi:hypothetical protein
MNRVTRALTGTLVAALAIPPAAVAQDPQPVPEVRLTFEVPRPANPWAVFGNGLAVTGREQSGGSGGRLSDVPPNSPPAARPRLARPEASQTTLAKNRVAAKRRAGQSVIPSLPPGTRPIVVVLVTIACVVLVALAESAGR